jgi:protein TonB
MNLPTKLTTMFAICAVCLFAQKEPKKLSKAEALNDVITRVQPEYPVVARQLKLGGEVEVEVVITEEGVTENVRIVSGNPVLTKPCVEALKRWKFKPFTENGKAIKAVADLTFTFQRP